MSQRIVIDCLVFALEAGSLQDDLPVASLSRTLDLLTNTVGSLRYLVVEGRESVIALNCY